jgi:hypothetical protein
MLFFLLLNAAPAMNYPSADDDNSPRKKWLEIDSQILNALFCVTGFGLAPWRFRDLYRFLRVVFARDRTAMKKLAAQNSGWFRTPDWYTHHEDTDDGAVTGDPLARTPTFTGSRAPPTAMWKLGLVISMMVMNTLFQVVLSYFMWAYNRFDRPVCYDSHSTIEPGIKFQLLTIYPRPGQLVPLSPLDVAFRLWQALYHGGKAGKSRRSRDPTLSSSRKWKLDYATASARITDRVTAASYNI